VRLSADNLNVRLLAAICFLLEGLCISLLALALTVSLGAIVAPVVIEWLVAGLFGVGAVICLKSRTRDGLLFAPVSDILNIGLSLVNVLICGFFVWVFLVDETGLFFYRLAVTSLIIVPLAFVAVVAILATLAKSTSPTRTA
jgi:hypothetical protein